MTFRRARLDAPAPIASAPLRMEDAPEPAPGPGQIALRVRTCGVCHTDLHTVEGDVLAPTYPVTPGHQVVGVVDAVGPDVTGWSQGDRAGVAWLHSACGACEACARGDENLCACAHFTGLHVPGGYAERMLADARFALRLPEEIDDVAAAPLLCAGIVGYRSLRLCDLEPGERLGLYGFGASAHLAIQVAVAWGCEVCVFTRGATHRALAERLGAVWVGGADDRPPRPLDRAVVFAPAGSLVPRALERLRPGGTLALNAIHMSPVPEMPYAILWGERTVRSVANATRQDGRAFLDLAARLGVRAETRTWPLASCNDALRALGAGDIDGAGVLVAE